MFFAIFAQKLHVYIRHPEGQAAFVKKLLENCLPESFHTSLQTDSSLKRYYKGKTNSSGNVTADAIGHYAPDICDQYQPDRLAEYLQGEIEKANNAQKLCVGFQDVLPDITPENYPAQLAELMGNLLKEAASGNQQNQAANQTVSAVQPMSSNVLTAKDKRILKRILTTIDCLFDELTIDTPSFPSLFPPKEKEDYLNRMSDTFSFFIRYNLDMKLYFETYPQLTTIEDLTWQSSCLDENMDRIWRSDNKNLLEFRTDT